MHQSHSIPKRRPELRLKKCKGRGTNRHHTLVKDMQAQGNQPQGGVHDLVAQANRCPLRGLSQGPTLVTRRKQETPMSGRKSTVRGPAPESAVRRQYHGECGAQSIVGHGPEHGRRQQGLLQIVRHIYHRMAGKIRKK